MKCAECLYGVLMLLAFHDLVSAGLTDPILRPLNWKDAMENKGDFLNLMSAAELSEGRSALFSNFTFNINVTYHKYLSLNYNTYFIPFFNLSVDGNPELYDGEYTYVLLLTNYTVVNTTLVVNQLGPANVISNTNNGRSVEAEFITPTKDIKINFNLSYNYNDAKDKITLPSPIDEEIIFYENMSGIGIVEYEIIKKSPFSGVAKRINNQLCVNGTSETENGTSYTYEGCLEISVDPVKVSGPLNTSLGSTINVILKPKSDDPKNGLQYKGEGTIITSATSRADVNEKLVITGSVSLGQEQATLAIDGFFSVEEVVTNQNPNTIFPFALSGIGDFLTTEDGFALSASMLGADGLPFNYDLSVAVPNISILIDFKDSIGNTFNADLGFSSYSNDKINVRGVGKSVKNVFSVYGSATPGNDFSATINSLTLGKFTANLELSTSPQGEQVFSGQLINTMTGEIVMETSMVIPSSTSSTGTGFQTTIALSETIGTILFTSPSYRCPKFIG